MTRAYNIQHERVTRDPAIMAGKPVVRGTRIPVEMVLEQLAYKPDLEELFAMYPDLTLDDVRACLAYARLAVSARRSRSARGDAPHATSA